MNEKNSNLIAELIRRSVGLPSRKAGNCCGPTAALPETKVERCCTSGEVEAADVPPNVPAPSESA